MARKNKYKSPVAKRLKKLNENLSGTTEKLFRELQVGEEFSMEPDGPIMSYNGEVTGCSSMVSPTRMCYFMTGRKDETRVDGTKEDLLNTIVYSYGVPDDYEPESADDFHDQECIDAAYSTTYRDSIIDCANRCRKAENRKLILSLLDDPDVIIEENFKMTARKTAKKKSSKKHRVNESYEMEGGYPVMDNDQIREIYKWVAEDKWIASMINHFVDVRDSHNNDDHKELEYLTLKHVLRNFTGLEHKNMKCIFGYYKFVVDIDIVYKNMPAYIHIVKEINDNKWMLQVFKKGQ